jgi:predicted XRE-type DNA-binding protein
MMEKRVYKSVWDALEDSPEQATNMRMRSELMIALRAQVESWDTTQARAAKRLRITQPRLNDLLRGRIDRFSLDALVSLAEHAGLDVRLRVKVAA